MEYLQSKQWRESRTAPDSGEHFVLQQLNMPSILEQIAEISRGLVLVTGPTGSGKSTTLAAVINHIIGQEASIF